MTKHAWALKEIWRTIPHGQTQKNPNDQGDGVTLIFEWQECEPIPELA
jgi:hypothetical protein